MPKFCLNVFTNCTDLDRHDEFNRWYSLTHLPDLSKAFGFVSARRFENQNAGDDYARYYAQYEFDCDDHGRAVISFLECAEAAYRAGRHIDCISDAKAAPGAIWVAIDLAEMIQLDDRVMDYPKVPPKGIGNAIEAMKAKYA